MTHRPCADVVVPFAGSDGALRAALTRLATLRLAPGDTLTVVDNRADPGTTAVDVPAPMRMLAAREQPGSYYARNRGAARGSNPWLVFLDADVDPPRDLLDRYLTGPLDDRCGLLGGAVVDEPGGAGATSPAIRYAEAIALMSQERTLERPEFAYFQTANVAVRRAAFEAIGGFRTDVRSGGDADLCFRLRDGGWTLESRPDALVTHRSRATLRALLRQRIRVGAGAGWLEEQYPGFAPRRSLPRALAGNALRAMRGAVAFARGGGDPALVRTVDALADAAFQVGRRLPNRVGPRR